MGHENDILTEHFKDAKGACIMQILSIREIKTTARR